MPQNEQSEHQEFQTEYQYIKSDVKKVIATNLLIIILLVALFFVNQKTGILNKLLDYF